MTTKPPGTGRMNPVAYAEQTLGVHAVFEIATTLSEEHAEILAKLVQLRHERRMVEELIESRDLEIYSDERGKHPDLSQAALERHMKVELNRDSARIALRSKLNEVVSEIDLSEASLKSKSTDIQIAVARMNELGGYFTFLAAVKSAGNSKNT